MAALGDRRRSFGPLSCTYAISFPGPHSELPVSLFSPVHRDRHSRPARAPVHMCPGSSPITRRVALEQLHCVDDATALVRLPTHSSTLGARTGFRKESIFQTRKNCILNTKTQRRGPGLPQYLRDNLLRSGTATAAISVDQLGLDLPCLQEHLSAQT
jgi:hypothetical protein